MKDGGHRNYSGPFGVWHLGWSSVCARSVFHSLEYPSPPAPPAVLVKSNFAKTLLLFLSGVLTVVL